MLGILKKVFGTQQSRIIARYKKIVEKINSWDEQFNSLPDDEFKNKTIEFKKRLHDGETTDQILPEAYGIVKNTCRRLVGTDIHVSGYDQQWDMVPYDVQLIGAIAMHYGSIAEMQTGEGKTLTATMPLYLNALTGRPTHLITVNDYLAQRDCQWMHCVYSFLGVTTGALTTDTPQHQRKEIYSRDIVYGTCSEFGFDYLRDNSSASTKEGQVQRGYYFAIIDEVDSILIDEARTPLIISGPVSVSRQMYDKLKEGVALLVRKQRDLCNRLASEGYRVLKSSGMLTDNRTDEVKDREQQKKIEEAYRNLWLVSKGTPRNRLLKRVQENPGCRAEIDKWDLFYYSDQNKDEKAKALAELLIIIDEKSNEFELTDKGIAMWAQYSGDAAHNDFIMIDVSEEYINIDKDLSIDDDEKLKRKIAIQDEDEKRKERAHNLRQLFRAHLLMEQDIDYIVQENKIIIIDENTGRPQPGRRFSDGLHQAIEAKENVSIQKETQTYATITLQNYFRMYDKLAGMTGTAMTEASEFKEIYKLQVLEIPPNRPCIRIDSNDEIYMSEREKYTAILKEIKEINGKGNPILIGTESVEVSEKLSRILKQHKLRHTVLNAKNHAYEAEIISNAGQLGSITIATNMAGRGTDIKLGAGVAFIGGLHVIGTSRHHSRRIDRQLRGRCARQGDPGASKFYACFEDPLMRLFGSSKWTALLQKLSPPEGEPISAGVLNKSIETAQKRVEQRNYIMRKHTLEYDDIMNKHRQEIYSFRNDVIRSDDIIIVAIDLLEFLCCKISKQFFNERNLDGEWQSEQLRQWLISHFPVTFKENIFIECSSVEEVEKIVSEKVVYAFKEKINHEKEKTEDSSGKQTHIVDDSIRRLMINIIDRLWQEHLLIMDDLRSDVQMHSIGQKDPLMEFKHEAFVLFNTFIHDLQVEIARDMFKFELIPVGLDAINKVLKSLQLQGPQDYSLESDNTLSNKEAKQPVSSAKIKRNDLCPCGSGKKYKKCCGVYS